MLTESLTLVILKFKLQEPLIRLFCTNIMKFSPMWFYRCNSNLNTQKLIQKASPTSHPRNPTEKILLFLVCVALRFLGRGGSCCCFFSCLILFSIVITSHFMFYQSCLALLSHPFGKRELVLFSIVITSLWEERESWSCLALWSPRFGKRELVLFSIVITWLWEERAGPV